LNFTFLLEVIMKKLFIAVIAILCVHGFVYADIAPDPINSCGLTPVKKTKVQMQSEIVKVELNPSYATVQCTFNMKNTGDKETLEVGFPKINLGWHGYGKRSKDGEMKEFEVTVDGKRIDCAPKFIVDGKEVAGKKKPWEVDETENTDPNKNENHYFKEWYTWNMTFKKGEKLKVEVSYKQPFGQTYSPGVLNKRYFEYILETGEGWHGKIEKAEVEIKFKDMTKDNVIKASPEKYKLTKEKITWTLKNIEPTREHNIRVDYKGYADFEAAFKARKGKIESWQDAWVALYCAYKAKKTDDLDKIIEKGVKLANEEKYGRLKKESRLLAIYQQVARIKYLIYKKKKDEKSKKAVLEIFEKIHKYTKTLINDEKIDKLFKFEDFDKGVYKWVLETDLCGDDYMTSWKGPSSFFYGWEREIKKLAGIEEKKEE